MRVTRTQPNTLASAPPLRVRLPRLEFVPVCLNKLITYPNCLHRRRKLSTRFATLGIPIDHLRCEVKFATSERVQHILPPPCHHVRRRQQAEHRSGRQARVPRADGSPRGGDRPRIRGQGTHAWASWPTVQRANVGHADVCWSGGRAVAEREADSHDGGVGVFGLQAQVITPLNGDPFLGMLETPITSNGDVAKFLSNLPAYRTGVAPTLRGVEIGLAHGFLIAGPFIKVRCSPWRRACAGSRGVVG
jgi:hypothetical protein